MGLDFCFNTSNLTRVGFSCFCNFLPEKFYIRLHTLRLVPGAPMAVRPDGITGRVGFFSSRKTMRFSSHFFEAKVTTKNITRRHRKAQIMGMIDAASRRNPDRGRPAVHLITTLDSKVHRDVILYANRKNVHLFQSIAAIDDETGEFSISNPVWLNEESQANPTARYPFAPESNISRLRFDDFDNVDPSPNTTPRGRLGGGITGDPDPAQFNDN